MDEIENEKAQKVEDKKMMDKMVAEYEQDKADETRMLVKFLKYII